MKRATKQKQPPDEFEQFTIGGVYHCVVKHAGGYSSYRGAVSIAHPVATMEEALRVIYDAAYEALRAERRLLLSRGRDPRLRADEARRRPE